MAKTNRLLGLPKSVHHWLEGSVLLKQPKEVVLGQFSLSVELDTHIFVAIGASCVMPFEMLNNLPIQGIATEHIQNLVNLCHFDCYYACSSSASFGQKLEEKKRS